MEVWARRFPNAQFLCVCVDSKGVALQFQHMFGLDRALNCWIPDRRYFPVGYGQLGCSGFIISDKHGNFVSRKTKAFLQYGEAAFDDVEGILSSLLPKPGDQVSAPKTEVVKVASKQEEEKKVDEIEAPVSVGVKSMDEDHEQCSIAISELLKTQTVKALRTVLKELGNHFDHEESLMKKYNFGNASEEGNEFSAFANHVKDHKRILNLVSNEIEAVSPISSSE